MSLNRDRQMRMYRADRSIRPLDRMVRHEDSVLQVTESDPDETAEQERKDRAARAKRKIKPKPKPKPKAKPKGDRVAKVKRVRALWGVFNDAHQLVASYAYSKKAEAEAQAQKLIADKRALHFVQPIKASIVENSND